jgi:hypothetical protein
MNTHEVEVIDLGHGVHAHIENETEIDEIANPRHMNDGLAVEMYCWHRRYSLGDDHNYEHPGEWLAELIEDLTPDQVLPLMRLAVAGKVVVGNKSFRQKWDYRDYMRGMDLNKSQRRAEWVEFLQDNLRETNSRSMHEQTMSVLREAKGYEFRPLYLFDHSGITISTTSQFFRGMDLHGWDWGQVGWLVCRPERLEDLGVPDQYRSGEGLDSLIRNEVDEYDKYLRGDVFFVWTETPEEHGFTESCSNILGLDEAREVAQELGGPLAENYGDPTRTLGAGI